jgi:predicted MFS family arabinose efflux permease
MPLMSPRKAVSTVFFVNGYTFGGIAVEMPIIKERLAIGDAELGRLLLCMAIGSIVTMPFAGFITRRLGTVGAIRFAGLAFILLVASVSVVPALGYGAMVALFLVIGSMNGLMDVTMNAEGVNVERALGRPIMSSLHGFWSIGGFAAAAFAWLVLDRLGPFGHLGGAFLIGLGLLGAALVSLTNVPTDAAVAGSGFSLPTRATLAIGVLTTMAMICEGAMMDWGAIYMRDVLHVTPGDASTALFAFAGGMAAGRFAGDWVRGHWSAVFLTRVSGIAAVVGFLVVVATPYLPVVGLGYVIGGLGLSNLVPVMFGAGARVPGVSPETAVAGIATVGYAGFLIGPTLIGLIAEDFGLTVALGIVLVFGSIIAAFAGATRTADAPDPTVTAQAPAGE